MLRLRCGLSRTGKPQGLARGDGRRPPVPPTSGIGSRGRCGTSARPRPPSEAVAECATLSEPVEDTPRSGRISSSSASTFNMCVTLCSGITCRGDRGMPCAKPRINTVLEPPLVDVGLSPLMADAWMPWATGSPDASTPWARRWTASGKSSPDASTSLGSPAPSSPPSCPCSGCWAPLSSAASRATPRREALP